MISPTFEVPSADQMPRLRFWHYYRFSGDFGEVHILPAGSNQWGSVSIWGWGTTGGVWVRPSLDLSPWAGQTVQLALHFHAEDYGSNGWDTETGWYVDELVIQTGPVERCSPMELKVSKGPTSGTGGM